MERDHRLVTDMAPSVGYTGKDRNVFDGIGYSGHGVNLTSVFGRIIAIWRPAGSSPGSVSPSSTQGSIMYPTSPFDG